jgi:hypothetical protein
MTLDVNSVIMAIVALTVLLLVAGAEARWRRRGRRAKPNERRLTSAPELVTSVIHPARRHPVGRLVSGPQGLEHARRLPRRPEAGWERDLIKIIAVYRTSPVMVVGETAQGALLERTLHELADGHDGLPPQLWRELVERYQVFQIT